jgi:uncharacterized membrane protein
MGQLDPNVGLKAMAHTISSTDVERWEFRAHWGDKSVNSMTVITKAEAEDLIAASKVSQAAFDTTAGALATWYAFSGLSSANRDRIRQRLREAVYTNLAGLKT